MDLIIAWLRDHPVLLFAAIAILPGFGVPSSPLLILAGISWGTTPQSCALALAAVAINIAWSHLLATGPARQLLTRILGSRLARFQSASQADKLRLAALVRFTPGVPLCVQNYTLGLLGVPLRSSLAIAIPTTAVHVCGFVITGGAIFEGRLGIILLGVSLLIIAAIGIHYIRRRILDPK